MDPRMKIALMTAMISACLIAQNAVEYAILSGFVLAVVLLARVPISLYLKTLKPLAFFIVFTCIINLFSADGEILAQWWIFRITREGITLAGLMMIRVILLVFISSLLTYTTSPIQLTNGLESLMRPLKWVRFPSHDVAMMMTIALRFIPTLIEEADKIIKAQSARGIDFQSGGLIKRIKALVPVLIPLFVSAFHRADELAVAMESRCYRGGEGRTSMIRLRVRAADWLAATVCVALITGLVMI
jgi:energy-coupling factor transport system permease protein